MSQFRVFRAIGIALEAWIANFIPITLVAAIFYAPPIVLAVTMADRDDPFTPILWVVTACSSLVSPFITYRVIQHRNGRKASMLTSVAYGSRGIAPAAIVGGVTAALSMLPSLGGLGGAILQCFWFVAGPAAVVERLGPFAALSRSMTLTQSRRGGIFGLTFLLRVALVIAVVVIFVPIGGTSADQVRRANLEITPILCAFYLFMGIVQAVSYSLLRADKDGVSNEELARVFE